MRHTVKAILDVLRPVFKDRIISRRGEKPRFESQARHQNKKKVFLRRFPQQISDKTRRVIKSAMKSYSKNLSFGVDGVVKKLGQ